MTRGAGPHALTDAVAVLRRGGVVVMPTETVYGLAADATCDQAVARIFALKQRPAKHPLIVHITEDSPLEWAELQGLTRLSGRQRQAATELAEAFWPGPLSLVVPRGPSVASAVCAGGDTVGLRVPAHPVAQALIKMTGLALAAPSANRFSQTSPTDFASAMRQMGELEGLLGVDGGACDVGLESTVLRIHDDGDAEILRAGVLGARALEQVGCRLRQAAASAPSPGQARAHYGTRAPLRVIWGLGLEESSLIRAAHACISTQGVSKARTVLITFRSLESAWTGLAHTTLGRGEAYRVAAQALYRALIDADRLDPDLIIVEAPEGAADAAVAIRDRLTRAEAGTLGMGKQDSSVRRDV